jgi:hypothetical protein
MSQNRRDFVNRPEVSAPHPLVHMSNLLVRGFYAFALSTLPAMALAQSAGTATRPASTELEAILFVQSPQPDNGKGAIRLVWIPEPIQRLCLGKTAKQCSTIDYCVRTTNPEDNMCRNLRAPRLPSYPRDMRPRRQMSVYYFPAAPIKNFAMLQDFYHRAPRRSLQRLSLSARVKARVRFTRTVEDDDFDVLEILAVAPF